jgi:hypothetical protein
MPVPPAKILKSLRNAHQQLIAPINAAEAALTKAERALTTAQQACIDATRILVEVDKTVSTMIDPLRAQAQAAYDAAQARQKVAQLAVAVATTALIDAYAVCAQYAFLSYTAAMQAVDPEFRDPRADEATAHTQTVTQPPLFVEKPDIKGKKK